MNSIFFLCGGDYDDADEEEEEEEKKVIRICHEKMSEQGGVRSASTVGWWVGGWRRLKSNQIPTR